MRVLFYDKETEKVIEYDHTQHKDKATQFVYWGGNHELLICGDAFDNHVELSNAFRSADLNLPIGDRKSKNWPVGAGETLDGHITSWRGPALDIWNTTVSDRALIRGALRME